MDKSDWIRLLESSYALELADDRAWKRGVLHAAAPLFGEARGFAFLELEDRPDGYVIDRLETAGDSGSLETVLAVNANAPSGALDLVYGRGSYAGTLSENVFPFVPGSRDAFAAAGGGARDVLGAAGNDGQGRVAALAASIVEPRRTRPAERRRFRLAMVHVAAGMRLRRALAALAAGEPAAAATLDPEGHVLDTQERARSRSAREALRDAVVRSEAARTSRSRGDPESALEQWSGLVDGRWSLIDRFDSDGRRFVVAIENDPRHADPRGLTQRERQLSQYVGLGQSTKEIAYALGLSLSAVSMGIGSAVKKLGFSSRPELAAFFSPRGLRARLSRVDVGGERFWVGAQFLLDEAALGRLSEAEREVATLLLAGSTTADIAERRGTSVFTVGNQIASIHRKLGVVSRIELAARVYADSEAENSAPD